MSAPLSQDGGLLGSLNRQGINTVALVAAILAIGGGWRDVQATRSELESHKVKAEADKKELQLELRVVREEQVRSKEQTASIVNALGRVEKQLEQSTVVVRANGRVQ